MTASPQGEALDFVPDLTKSMIWFLFRGIKLPIIIAIALLIFVFKGGIFVVFGWLFRAIMAVFEFFATIFSDISMGRYFKKRDKERKKTFLLT